MACPGLQWPQHNHWSHLLIIEKKEKILREKKHKGSDRNDHTFTTAWVQKKQKPVLDFKDTSHSVTIS